MTVRMLKLLIKECLKENIDPSFAKELRAELRSIGSKSEDEIKDILKGKDDDSVRSLARAAGLRVDSNTSMTFLIPKLIHISKRHYENTALTERNIMKKSELKKLIKECITEVMGGNYEPVTKYFDIDHETETGLHFNGTITVNVLPEEGDDNKYSFSYEYEDVYVDLIMTTLTGKESVVKGLLKDTPLDSKAEEFIIKFIESRLEEEGI